MSGVCPTCPAQTKNAYNKNSTAEKPAPAGNSCACTGGSSTVTPDPPTPCNATKILCYKGQWAEGTTYKKESCYFDSVIHNECLYICKTTHTSTKDDSPWTGEKWADKWEKASGNVVWRSTWAADTQYNERDYVTLNKTSYMCTIKHKSTDANKPDPDLDGGDNWKLVAGTGEAEEKSWLDSIFDWFKNIGNWGLGDWLLAGLLGAGLLWAGKKIKDIYDEMTDQDGVGDGEAGSVLNGDNAYTGAYTDPTLPQVMSTLCQFAGVTNYDVSLLPAKPINMTIANITSAREVIELLRKAYFFDVVDDGTTLKFIPRNTSVVKTLTYDDIGYGTTTSTPYYAKRWQGIDLPRKVTVKYYSRAADYNQMTQEVELYTNSIGQNVELDVPFTITESEAQEIAYKTLINAHIERMNFSFDTSYEHVDLLPGDVVTTPMGDVRITEIKEQDDGRIGFACVDASFNDSTYSPPQKDPAQPTEYIQTIPVIGYSGVLPVELPPLNSSDTTPRIFLAPHGYGLEGWTGCNIYRSLDGENTYQQIDTTMEEATWGLVETPIPAPANQHVWDNTTEITVKLKTGTLVSRNAIDVLNGMNFALVGEEVIAFRTKTLIATNTYKLTGLLRGMRGTEQFCGTHVADELFLLLDGALLEVPYTKEQRTKQMFFKAVTIGSDISKAKSYEVIPSTKSAVPWAVCSFKGEKNDTTGAWHISWISRNHVNGEMVDSGPVPQPYNFGGFILQILDSGGNSKRDLNTTDMFLDYTTEMQIEDFGAQQNSVTVRIAQVDIEWGPGYVLTETF